MFISFVSIETGFEAQNRQEWARITRKLRQSLRDGKALEEEEKMVMVMVMERKKKKKRKKRTVKSLVFMVL